MGVWDEAGWACCGCRVGGFVFDLFNDLRGNVLLGEQ